MTSEGLCGHRKTAAPLRVARGLVPTTPRAVERVMHLLELSGVRRDRRDDGVRTTVRTKEGICARDLLIRDFTAAVTNCVWVTDFTNVRTWAVWANVTLIIDMFSQWIVARPPLPRKRSTCSWSRCAWPCDNATVRAPARTAHPPLRCRIPRQIQLVVTTP